ARFFITLFLLLFSQKILMFLLLLLAFFFTCEFFHITSMHHLESQAQRPHTVRGTPTSRLSVPKSIACSVLREGFGWQRIIQGLLVVCGGARHLARLSVLTVVCSAYRTPKFWGRCTGLEWFGAIRIPTGGLSCMDMACAIVTVWSIEI